MLDKFLVLLERFVVAHELIAANSAKPVAVASEAPAAPEAAEREPKATAKRTRTAKPKAAPEPEPEPKAKAKSKKAAEEATGKK